MKRTVGQLAEIYNHLPDSDQKTLFEFAEFLKSRTTKINPEMLEVVDIPRPKKETVVNAIKRLKKSYPMIQQTQLLGETSDLMTRHLIRGVPAKEIIDELETVFREKYQAFLEKNQT